MATSVPERVGHPWHNRHLRRWLLGSAISLLGDQGYLVALPWLILQTSGSVGLFGTVMMAGALPRLALLLVGGAVTDRVPPRRVMLVTAAARAVCVAVIGTLAAAGMLVPWEIYALVVAFGIADTFALPTQTAAAHAPGAVHGDEPLYVGSL